MEVSWHMRPAHIVFLYVRGVVAVVVRRRARELGVAVGLLARALLFAPRPLGQQPPQQGLVRAGGQVRGLRRDHVADAVRVRAPAAAPAPAAGRAGRAGPARARGLSRGIKQRTRQPYK